MKKYIPFVFLFLLLLIVPVSFANDNSTDLDSSLSFGGDEDVLSSNIIYFNSSAKYDGNGSQSSPYKYFSTNKVKENSTLYFADGEYSLDKALSFSNITIIGESPLKTIINGNGRQISSSNVLYISDITLNNLLIKNIHEFIANNVIFQNSKGTGSGNVFGGAINVGSSVTALINSSVFRNNKGTYGGAIYASGDSNLVIVNSTFENNHADMYGGAIAIENGVNFQLVNSTFLDCYSVHNAGGAIYSRESILDIKDSNFTSCNATFGGAIYASGDSNLVIVNSTFENNHADMYGGAIAIENGVGFQLVNSTFLDCYSVHNAGGAIYSRESFLDIKNSNFTSCNASIGGAICDLKSFSIFDSIIAENNKADYYGGAIYKMYGTIEVISSSFFSNEASNGGAMYIDNSSYLLINSSSFSYNIAKDYGGAIYTVFNINETLNSVNFKDNRAKTENNYYKTDCCNMLIGNGNYTMIKGDFEFNGTLPSRYDLRDYGWVSPVKNQKSSGNCWAFTAISALESCILKATNQTYDFSEENLKNVMTYYSDYGWVLVPNKGGYDDMGVAYLISWLGVVNEGFESYDVNTVLSPVLNSSIHVQNIVYLTRNNYTDNDAIKEAIIKYGGVATGIYYSGTYLNKHSYYYSGGSGQNHAITVVGWDDNYSKTNFKTTPEGDGAWICKNSWGDTWGEKGYFYVSYYDTSCVRVGPYDKSTYTLILNDTVHYDKNYQYDIIGITDYFITGMDTIWYENIFNATDNEFLTAFSTYFNMTTNWTAQIYVNDDLKVVENGTSDAGYYTFDLDNPIPLNIGDTFKIVIKISTDKYASFPVSERVRSNRVLYKEGVSFFSFDGENWTDLYDFKYNASEFSHNYESQVACIKAFTSFVHNTTISISDTGVIPVYELVNLTAVVKDEYGNKINSGEVNFTIGSESYTVPIIDYTATLTMKFNSRGIYTVNAEYLGDTLYCNSSTSKKINVDFTDLNLTLIVSDAYYGEDILIYNSLISNGIEVDDYINVTINNKTYSIKSNNLTSIKEALNPNEYTAYAAYYNITTSDTFNVYKIPVSIMMDIKNIGIGGVNISIMLSEPLNASVNVSVNSELYPLITKNGVANLILSDLYNGNYTVIAVFGSDYYENATACGNFSINVNLTLIVSDAYYGEDILIYNSLISNGIEVDDYINVTINNKTYSIKSNNLTSIKEALNPNEYTAYATYYNFMTSDTFNVYKIPVSIMMDIKNIGIDGVNISIMLSEPLNASVNVSVNSELYPLITRNGVANLILSDLYYGNYTVNAVFVSDYYENVTACGNFSINYIKTSLIANNVTLYYRDGTRFYVKLVDSKNNPLVNENVIFSINGINYTKYYTDENGECSLGLNLNSGSYPISLTYLGNGKYLPTNFTGNVLIKPTIVSSDITKIFRNATPFTATILDNKGNIARNTEVSININGVFYHKVSDDNGVVRLNLNLPQGTYILTTYNPLTGENAANTVTIIPSIVENYNLTKYYKNDSKYSVKILGDDGTPLANAEVSFNINGVFYKRTTDADGYASLSINLIPNKYIITAEYNGCRVSNVIEVLSVLESSDLSMKYRDGSKFKVKVLDGLGNPNPLKEVTFNVNGIFYNRLTDENGFAYLNINLPVGKYIITSSFNGLNAANTITIT